MPLDNRKKGLRELLRARGLAPKVASRSQPPLPPPPPPPPSINPFAPANLKKRKKEKEITEEKELVPHEQQKIAKGKGKASSVKSKEDRNVVEVCLQNPTWDPSLELDGAAIPRNSTIREFQRGNAHYLVETLEQPLLLLRDMAGLKTMRQLDLLCP